ncbi:MAG: RecQ family ATP-dependent DNA helicase, partial [Oscillospiraceae bacterium]|nr:RecQ family ATP-dependent DNA helicase [Oscillospiraceae bacterium]
MDKKIIFIDTEVDPKTNKVLDYGAVTDSDNILHTKAACEFDTFIQGYEFICGHNILKHDWNYISHPEGSLVIDTLTLSPLLFPNRPYHKLLKDDKLQTDELNNPLNDSKKAKQLFYDEVNAFQSLYENLKNIYACLLAEKEEFENFWKYLDIRPEINLEEEIRNFFENRICQNVDIETLIQENPVELAYCLALITASDRYSVIPHWVHINYPKTEPIIRQLRNTPCGNCPYCREKLNPKKYLKEIFGHKDFRKYHDEPLQENAVNAAIQNKSLLAVFPTGGGKSLTFQIPALMAGELSRALTVVISPLQSLMKDQIDNLEKHNVAEAVTINGLLSPIERAEALERVANGIASILYISPESLRSKTIERLLLSRNIDRFVIDEAHCFSAWGQDFRVDYLYIGDFIRELQDKKGNGCQIPISCFTATPKQKVISDIKDYFKRKLNLELQLFATDSTRQNLRYEVLHMDSDEQKYITMRNLIEKNEGTDENGKKVKYSAIVYVSRTKRTYELAEKLCANGITARPFNGKMDSAVKQENQNAFINNEIQVIVATSAFGMGVDKSDVRLVIHYDISDSLENYVQEAGRAGRDQKLNAECYVLYNDSDLDKHFMLLNQTKLSISEIQQVWTAVKNMTKEKTLYCSPLEIARRAGWDDSGSDMETRVKSAIQALENAGYVKRGKNVPRVYATSILIPNMTEAGKRIDASEKFFDDNDRMNAKRIIKSLISSRSIANAGNADAESRVDYLADLLGMEKKQVIRTIQMLREESILADSKDLTAYIRRNEQKNKSLKILQKYIALEKFLLEGFPEGETVFNLKELNENALRQVKTSTVRAIQTIFYYWTIRGYILKKQDAASNRIYIQPKKEISDVMKKRMLCFTVAEFIVEFLFGRSQEIQTDKEEIQVLFSVLELQNQYNQNHQEKIQAEDVEEALLYLSKIGSMKLEGGFLVFYGGIEIQRIELDNRIRYKKEDYAQLDEFYKQRIQQIHIVGEYANMMTKDYQQALQFVNDYFQMDYKKFIQKYFAGDREKEILLNMTPAKYHQLFDSLSESQKKIIEDNTSKYIVVSAAPGSGKTKVLVHKLASLLLLEDVKHEQLLMLTFSRAAATEFRNRLKELIGNAVPFVEIKTFHSYCFDLLGKIGNIQDSENIVKDAVQMINSGEVEPGRIAKTVLVIDEAQDMDENEFALIEALMNKNEEIHVIAVGDDDQNIYQFRGSDSKYFYSLITKYHAVQYDLLENYRSDRKIIDFANKFVKSLSNRMKKQPVLAVSQSKGTVKLIQYHSRNLESAVVSDMQESGQGTACILTGTNQQALSIMGILRQKNIPAKLIQSNDGFDIYNIAEIRYFLKNLEQGLNSHIVSKELWDSAKENMKDKYTESKILPLILEILETFENANEKYYISDLHCFLYESKLEDFCQAEQETVIVSTMHKAKGREFDSVYIMLDDYQIHGDEE